jgi:predicted transcriptional regulator
MDHVGCGGRFAGRLTNGMGAITMSGPDVTEAELAVLDVLWEAGPSAVRAIAERLYPPAGAAQVATVQKLLERLEAKDAVRRKRDGRSNLFEAAIERADLVVRRLRAVSERLTGGSFAPLLTHLVEAGELSAAELRELRGLVERIQERRRSRKN